LLNRTTQFKAKTARLEDDSLNKLIHQKTENYTAYCGS